MIKFAQSVIFVSQMEQVLKLGVNCFIGLALDVFNAMKFWIHQSTLSEVEIRMLVSSNQYY